MKFAIRGLTVLAAATALVAGTAVSPVTAAPNTAASNTAAPNTAAQASRVGKLEAKAATTVAHPYVQHKTKRVCSTATKAHQMSCFAIRQTDTVQPAAFKTKAVVPNAVPSGYGPASLASAYKLSSGGGSGATVAIVDAYNDPTAAADLGKYRSQFGLPACTVASGCLRIVNQNGATSPLPATDSGWSQEISLDLDMVSAVCPNCKIILVEATDTSIANLGTAVNTAISLGAKYVSNSYGGADSASDVSFDSSYFNHPGVAITASTGDKGNADGPKYPATSQYVTAVGGTSLSTASNTRGWTETAWSGAGSGCSSYDPKPSWQTVPTGCTRKAEADVSAVADPNTGVAVYLTTGGNGWAVFGGTSAAAPIVASVYALAGTPAAGTYPASYPYSHTSNLFDVTGGNNGSCGAPLCTAGTGWDGPTGLGTPNGTAAFTLGSTTITVSNPGNKTATVGTAITPFTLTASGGTTYTWAATGLPPGLAIGSTTGTISGTPTAAGTYSVTATATATPGGQSGGATFTITVSPVGGGCTGAGQKLTNPGFESGNTVWKATAGVIGQYKSSGQPPHGGTWDAWLDGYGTTHTDTLSQSVTIPAGCTNSTLSFYLHVDSAETTTTAQYDKLTVTIGSTTLATYSNLSKAAGYVKRSFSVGSFAGQTVVVKFTGTEDNSLPTSFVIDDAALTAS